MLLVLVALAIVATLLALGQAAQRSYSRAGDTLRNAVGADAGAGGGSQSGNQGSGQGGHTPGADPQPGHGNDHGNQ
jgi:hypothetical protein